MGLKDLSHGYSSKETTKTQAHMCRHSSLPATYTPAFLFTYYPPSGFLILRKNSNREDFFHELIYLLLLFRRKFRQVYLLLLTHVVCRFGVPFQQRGTGSHVFEAIVGRCSPYPYTPGASSVGLSYPSNFAAKVQQISDIGKSSLMFILYSYTSAAGEQRR